MWLSSALYWLPSTAGAGAGAVFRTLKKLGVEAAGGQHIGVLGPRVMEFCAANQRRVSCQHQSTMPSTFESLYLRTGCAASTHLNFATSYMSYQTEQRGSLYGDDFRMYFKDSAGNVVSPMHDIPLK